MLCTTTKIKRAFVAPESGDGDIIIKSIGVSIETMLEIAEILDFNRRHSNDISDVKKYHRIEGASSVIVKVNL